MEAGKWWFSRRKIGNGAWFSKLFSQNGHNRDSISSRPMFCLLQLAAGHTSKTSTSKKAVSEVNLRGRIAIEKKLITDARPLAGVGHTRAASIPPTVHRLPSPMRAPAKARSSMAYAQVAQSHHTRSRARRTQSRRRCARLC